MALTADWNPLGDVFYRKHEVYAMEWAEDVDLQKFIVAAAPYGGPIALIRDDRIHQKTPTSVKPTIYIYSSAGRLISSVKWNSGQVIKLGWSCTENLLCIQDDGSVLVYDIFGSFKRTFSMGQEAKDVKVIDCQVFNSYNGTGIAIVTSSYRLFLITNVEDPRIRRLAEIPGIEAPPSSWTIINHDRQCRALVAKGPDLYLLNHDGQCEKQSPAILGAVESYIEMAVSFNNKYLALFNSSGLLWIGSSDLQKVYCEFDTKCPMRPQQLVWCGGGAIVGYWENILLMVGPQKDWLKYSYDSPVHLIPEVDALRIVGHYTHELLQRVPAVVEDIFKIGSMSPGAMLYEASREFQRGSQRADEYIRMIKDKLDQAVEKCIEAAGQEYEPKNQKMLLRAASFGKCFLTDYQPESFVNMCQMLRVLNAVRDATIGLPLTYMQLHQLRLPVLIDRLVLRREYCLALRLCQYLRMPEAEGASRVLAHWACYKVQKMSQDDESVAQAIAQKLGDTPGVSYSEIANRAIECGRTDLAIRLLDFEPKAAEQVPLLMKMKKEKNALLKAIESGDGDLVYMVLLNLRETLPQGELFMAVRGMPTAYSLLLQYYRQQNRQVLKDLYYQEDNFQESGIERIVDSYEEESIDKRIGHLVSAKDAFVKAKNEWAAKQTEEQVALLKYQKKLEEDHNRPYLDKSLHQTLYQLITEANNKMVEQMRKDFKVPDRRFWWLKISALAEIGDWVEMEKFSKSKKSPIGFEPFIDVCMKYNNSHEAQKYMPKVTPENRVKCYIKIGQLDQAADHAFQLKSVEDLSLIQSKCSSNKTLSDKVQTMKAQLTGK